MDNYIIAINREYGSGGRIIGEKVASDLGIGFYDKKLITMTAEKSGFTEEFVKEAAEKKTVSLLYSLYMTSLPVSDQLFLAQSEVIRNIAASGESCVIVGSCADYVLRSMDNCIRVFVHAPLDDRIKRVREVYGEKAEDYKAYVLKQDKKRITYYNYFTQNKWGSAHEYHMTIDSSIGTDVVAQMVETLVKGFIAAKGEVKA